jgi:hypothetical protein
MGANTGTVSFRRLRKAKAGGDTGDLNPNRLERYLSKDEFKEVFGMSLRHFDQLPAWRQEGMKKELGLW